MAGERTEVTELATAAGMMLGRDHDQLDLLAALDIPGIPESEWRPLLEAAAEDWHQHHKILKAALANGAAFRASVLEGRDPRRIDWRGPRKAVWLSDAPVDLRVNHVYQVSAKYDSKCWLNGSPASVFDHLLAEADSRRSPNWYSVTAPLQHQAAYEALLDALRSEARAPLTLPRRPEQLRATEKLQLKYLMKPWHRTMPEAAEEAYGSLCRAVSDATAERWRSRLDAATEVGRLTMLARMLRVCGVVYWLLGQAGDRPVRARVLDTSQLRAIYRLKSFDVAAPELVGQPRVDWTAVLEPRATKSGEVRTISGICEVRWSHGKFSGNPECKVQLKTPVWELPGYVALDDV